MWARTLLSSSTLLLLFVVDATHGFALEGRRGSNCCRTKPHHRTIAATALSMGLFDGVKDAFSAPALERTSIDAERETPIDRWMGWSVAKENKNDGGGASSIQAGKFAKRNTCIC